MLRERKRRGVEGAREVEPFPKLDFNDPRQRRRFIFFVAATVLFLLIIAVASIKGYEYTESTAFCGKLCHTVMKPEYVAWNNSPHSRVRCAECHIGPGAEWFVKTKVSGLRQVYKVLTETYPRPIETPVADLRPARDTCEQCHWPKKFYWNQFKPFYHFAMDEKNSPGEIDLVIKTGGGVPARGSHWHINSIMFFQPRDRKRQDIPYIRVVGADGKMIEYHDTEKPLSRREISAAAQRRMDCVDCHNRPTHIFRSPSQEMDEKFIHGQIDTSLPYLKKTAVDLLSRNFRTDEDAEKTISAGITDFYRTGYPEVYTRKGAAIKNAVLQVQDIYRRNFFPHMKTAWYTHTDNIGHFYSPGCFRCHDGKHRSADGRVVSRDCNLCHTVQDQKQSNIPPGTKVTHFIHPVDVGDEYLKTNCSDCHMAQAVK
jgi:nitrate/TMAO reductase-like tetraheme cytochrome c subunit